MWGRAKTQNIVKQYPFYVHEVADYEIIEFLPTKYHPDFAAFIET